MDKANPVSAHVTSEIRSKVLIVRINRAQKKNALTIDMYAALNDALRGAQDNGAIRAVLIAGQPGCFTAGNDIADFLDHPPLDSTHPVFAFLSTLASARKPLVAAVSGIAVGIGTTLLLHCDLVYAADDARFALPFVDLGVVPEAASSLLLPRLCGHQRAAELLLLGQPFGAEAAHDIGFVNEICAKQDVFEKALAAAIMLAGKPQAALMATKSLLKRGAEPIAERLAEENRVFAERLKSPEAKEAFNAFLERRKPDFSQFD